MSESLVEVLTFEGCPHAEPALELVRRVLAETGIAATVRRVDVPDADTAMVQRFLGSPTIRVNGRDIEPGTHERDQYALSCRVYRTERGMQGEPDERWLRDALHAAP
ncbi:MAG: hypothetical protein ACJ77E_06485 [Gaiellaceae bacterium]